MNSAIKGGDRAAELAIAWRRHPRGWRDRHPGTSNDDIKGIKGGSREHIGIRGEIRTEERMAHDLKGRVHDRCVNIDHRTLGQRIPVLDDALGGRGHVRHDRGQSLAMEGRLHHGALALPLSRVSGEQALPRDERERRILNRRLAVTACIGHEHAAHAIRVVDEIARRLGHRKLHDIAVGAPDGVEIGKRVLADGTEGAEHRLTNGARGSARSRHVATIGDRSHYGASTARSVRSAGTP